MPLIIPHREDKEYPTKLFAKKVKIKALLAVAWACKITELSVLIASCTKLILITFFSGKPPWNCEIFEISITNSLLYSSTNSLLYSAFSDEFIISMTSYFYDAYLIFHFTYDYDSSFLTISTVIKSLND